MVDKLNFEVLDIGGKKVGSIDLDPRVFDVPHNTKAVHQVVRWQRARKRAGTHATLNRARITGGGKKPFKQKGTGNARQGTRKSPLIRGGAVIHGPQPRSYDFKVPKKVKAQALSTVLSERLRTKSLVIVDSFDVESGKTKDMVAIINAVTSAGDAPRKVSLVHGGDKQGVSRSAKNIERLSSMSIDGMNVYDLIKTNFLILTKDTVEKIEERVLGQKGIKEA